MKKTREKQGFSKPSLKKQIMVVDDEENMRFLLKEILEKEGYRVVLAYNGDDCLRKLKKEKVDLVLLDIMMPGTPVRDVVRKITGKVAYVSVVGLVATEKKALVRSKRVLGIVSKPFDVNDLTKKVKDWLR